MQITIVNNSSEPVAAPGAVTVDAGDSLTLSGRTVSEYQGLIERYVADDVQVHVALESFDLPPLACTMKDPGDPGASVTTMAGVGFDIEDLYGAAFSTTDKMYLGVFDDADCTTPSADATLDTATTGTIESGAGTNVIKVTPAGGVFACSVDIPGAANQVVYLKAWAESGTTRAMGTNGTDSVTFSV